MPRPASRTPLVLLLLAAATLLLGCPAKLPQGATALDSVEIVGTNQVDDDRIEDAMSTDPSHKVLGLVRMWWIDYGIYDKAILDRDLKRIQRFYRARGYYDARVRAGRVIKTGDREVKVQVIVEEGAPVVVGAFKTVGNQKLPRAVRRQANAAWRLQVGDPFDEDLYRVSGNEIERALTDLGYAHASVRTAVDIDLIKRRAIVFAEIDAGPRCTFGPVKIVGLKELPEKRLRRILDVAEGDEYSTRLIRNAQQALFDLGVFETVSIDPDLTDPKATAIPLTVTVTEAKLRRVRAGPGVLIDPLRDDVHILLSWQDWNFLGGLRHLRYELRPLLMYKTTIRPGFQTGVDFTQPSFLEARTNGIVGASTGIIPDPANDYRMFSTRISFGVDRRFGPIAYGGLFYRRGWDTPTPYSDAPLPASVFQATIGYFEILGTLDTRDDRQKPRRGYYGALSLQYAFAPSGFARAFGGDFGDIRVQPEIRLFGPMGRNLSIAFRFMVGFVLPRNYDVHAPSQNTDPADPSRYSLDTTGETPLWRAFFSGGATSNRGYPVRYIGLRDCAIAADKSRQVGEGCTQVIGGASVWESSVELRFDLIGALSGVLFLDAADVSRERFDVRLDYPHLSAGPGLRYDTPVGPIRIDFGYRLPGLQRLGAPLDPRETPPPFSFLVKGPFSISLGIGEAF